MIVSWNWLKQYVPLTMSIEELEERLTMSGLNHEGTEEIGGDLALDLEVTSNRPDCLGHIGVAREVAVLWGAELTIPKAELPTGKTPAADLIKVSIECPDLCYRYNARVIRGVKIGPSPKWMARRLETLGITPINNVVDISNYVLMECGQPLHTFDLAKVKGNEIIVRRPKSGETIEAIDHREYELGPDVCLIADTERGVAIGGVMGGADSEITEATTDILIEAADFAPLSIRNTARALNLHSDASYRFERRVDTENLDWASRRCCELILELAGGELAEGAVDVGDPIPQRKPVTLRFAQLQRILGIDVPKDEVRRILVELGNEETTVDEESVSVIPASWRRDLTREIDLVEEVARIHGYDKIPEDVGVAMVASTRRDEDRVLEKIRHSLSAFGIDEAMTYSVVDVEHATAFSPWTDAKPLKSDTPVLRGADHLRLSLTPSLLMARRTNEALANSEIELFEIANVYLPRGKKLPEEQRMLGITSGRDYLELKGMIEAAAAALDPTLTIEAACTDIALLDRAASCALRLNGDLLGYVGRMTAEGLKRFDLRGEAAVAEIKLSLLIEAANLIPHHEPQPPYPAVTRDLNLVVDEKVRWADVAATVQANGDELLERLDYVDTYRDDKRLGTNKKSLLLSFALRSKEGTLTNERADGIRDQIVAACAKQHGAELR